MTVKREMIVKKRKDSKKRNEGKREKTVNKRYDS